MKVELWDIKKVTPYDNNVKNHTDAQVGKIAESIKKFGWDQPIVVDKEGVIIKGHGRRLAALSMKMKEVPVLVRDDLNEDEVKAARLADNRVAIGDIDTDKLQKEISAINIELGGIFDEKELDFMNADLAELNEDGFIDDIETEIQSQEDEENQEVEENKEKEIKIDKALGFNKIKTKDERTIAFFMALVKDRYKGMETPAAFVQFAKDFVEASGD